MSGYDQYDDRGYTSRRQYAPERERRDDRDPRYMGGADYGRGYPSRELIPRTRQDSELSVEEVRRDFPPPSGRDIRRARSANGYEEYYETRRSVVRPQDRDYDRGYHRSPGSTYYEEEREVKSKHKSMSKNEKIFAAVAGAVLVAGGKELYDRREATQDHKPVQRNALSSAALAGVGALAAYQGAEFYSKQQAKKDQKATYLLHRGRDGQIDEYYSSDEDGGREKKGHKNFLESALAATGLGAAVKSLTGGGSDEKSRGGSRSRSRSRGGGNNIQKAAMASLIAGATEAFRVSKEPGSWKGEKTKRNLTAAAGAATVDAATGNEHGKLGLAESVIGGLVGNRLINGSKNDIEEDKRTGRSRSRSRASRDGNSRGGLAALATAGLGAFAGKKIMDRSRSRSRARDHSEDYSRSRSRDAPRRSRSRSVVDKARNSLAKLGIGAGAGAAVEDSRRRNQDDYDDRSPRRSRQRADSYDDDYRYDRDRGYDDDRSYRGDRDNASRRNRSRSSRGYSSGEDLGDSDEDEKRHKKMRDRRR